MYIYDNQSYRNHQKISNLENRSFRYIRPQKSPKKRSLNRTCSKKIYRYGISFMVRGESSCPNGLEYVWERGVGPTL